MNTVIITDKMLHGGIASGKINGKRVFVNGALPSEEISITIEQEKKDYSIAAIDKILTHSPYRRNAPCPLYGVCGGCNLMHADDEYQKVLRASILRDAFSREGLAVNPVFKGGSPLSYRNRFQFESSGLKSAKSNTLITIPHCLVASDEVNAFLRNEKIPGKVKVFGSSSLVNTPKGYVFAADEEETKQTVMHRGKKLKTGGKRKIYEGTSINKESEAVLSLNDTELSFDVRGFFQSNIEMLKETAGLIEKLIPNNAKILDMYGGAGTLSALCARNASHVTLVEHNRDAVVFAEKNLRSISHSSFGLSGIQWIKTASDKNFDAVLIDPPRSGMEKEVCQWLCTSDIPLIISLSCDPVTHARDCAHLVQSGYEIETLYALDYYPQTSHVESLSVCIKK